MGKNCDYTMDKHPVKTHFLSTTRKTDFEKTDKKQLHCNRKDHY